MRFPYGKGETKVLLGALCSAIFFRFCGNTGWLAIQHFISAVFWCMQNVVWFVLTARNRAALCCISWGFSFIFTESMQQLLRACPNPSELTGWGPKWNSSDEFENGIVRHMVQTQLRILWSLLTRGASLKTQKWSVRSKTKLIKFQCDLMIGSGPKLPRKLEKCAFFEKLLWLHWNFAWICFRPKRNFLVSVAILNFWMAIWILIVWGKLDIVTIPGAANIWHGHQNNLKKLGNCLKHV